MNSKRSYSLLALIAIVTLMLAGCSHGGSSLAGGSGAGNGTVNMMISDAPVNDWAAIDVTVLSIALNPQGGGAPVNVYTAPNPAPLVNLVELDELAEILGNASVPPGTYTSATLTLGANPGDVKLMASEDPDPGFAGMAGASVPQGQIQIQGASGSVGSRTVPLNVNFVSPFVVTGNQNNGLDLEFDLSHPAFLVAHVPPALGTVEWAVNFNGPVRHHPIRDMRRLLLRDLYGNVSSVSSDDTSIIITKDFPAEPPSNPETAAPSSTSLAILADPANGTIFYDLDAKTHTTIFNFTAQATLLVGKFVRVAARYQVDGTLVAVRIWASSSFNTLWVNPEGHVLHVDTTANTLTVDNEIGGHVRLNVVDGANPTQFFFQTPANGQTDANAIGSGTAFLNNVKRGFKVHVKVVDPLASPLVADTVDIEVARFDGAITNSNTIGFDYTRIFNTPADSYTNFPVYYIASATANGNDPLTGNPITGFKYWNFAFPTLVTSGANAISNFVNATNGLSVNFGGSVGPLPVYGVSYAVWNDPAKTNNWDVPSAVLVPTPVPLGSVATAYSSSTGNFTMTVANGTNPITVDVNKTSGSAALVYRVDRNGGIVTISPVDITTGGGLNTFQTSMVGGTPIKIAGVPLASGHLQAYVIFYFTGNTLPAS